MTTREARTITCCSLEPPKPLTYSHLPSGRLLWPAVISIWLGDQWHPDQVETCLIQSSPYYLLPIMDLARLQRQRGHHLSKAETVDFMQITATFLSLTICRRHRKEHEEVPLNTTPPLHFQQHTTLSATLIATWPCTKCWSVANWSH